MRTLINIAIKPFMSSTELAGITANSNRWQVLAAVVALSECFVNRVIEIPRGFLLAGSVPGQPNTAAIYLYDEPEQCICQLAVGEAVDDFSDEELDHILPQMVHMLRELPMPAQQQVVTEPNRRRRNRNRNRNRNRRHHNSQGRNEQQQQPQKKFPARPVAPQPSLVAA